MIDEFGNGPLVRGEFRSGDVIRCTSTTREWLYDDTPASDRLTVGQTYKVRYGSGGAPVINDDTDAITCWSADLFVLETDGGNK